MGDFVVPGNGGGIYRGKYSNVGVYLANFSRRPDMSGAETIRPGSGGAVPGKRIDTKSRTLLTKSRHGPGSENSYAEKQNTLDVFADSIRISEPTPTLWLRCGDDVEKSRVRMVFPPGPGFREL